MAQPDDPSPEKIAGLLASEIGEFADLVDPTTDGRTVTVTVGWPDGTTDPVSMSAAAAELLTAYVRGSVAAVQRDLDDPQDDVGFDVWGR